MNQAKEDLLLHPVRMRILQAVGLGQATAQQLARDLRDVPQATLYRHINALVAGGILTVASERRVHNTIEKTYALAQPGNYLTPEDLAGAGPEDYLRLFTRYLGTLLGYYARYIRQGDVDLGRDGVSFAMLPLHLSQDEARQLGQAINEAITPHLSNEPSPDRRRFILGLLTLPDAS